MTDVFEWAAGPETTKEFARLSGDFNPIHLETEAAQAAGFQDMVVHGMCVLGVVQQAARALAPQGMVLRRLDTRFSDPVFPGQTLQISGEAKEKPDGTVRIGMKPRLGDKAVVSPANFTFGPTDDDWPVPPRFDTSQDDSDVVGQSPGLSEQDIADYTKLITPPGIEFESVAPMASLLSMTDALALAYGNRKPPKPGAWVHLRQQGDFYRPVVPGQPYTCRIQEGRAVVRKAKVGFQVVINFIVEEQGGGNLIATGTVTLMYLFDKDPE